MAVRADDVVLAACKRNTLAIKFEGLALERIVDELDWPSRNKLAPPKRYELSGSYVVIDHKARARKAIPCRTSDPTDVLGFFAVFADEFVLDRPAHLGPGRRGHRRDGGNDDAQRCGAQGTGR